jgi:hypothetical protein
MTPVNSKNLVVPLMCQVIRAVNKASSRHVEVSLGALKLLYDTSLIISRDNNELFFN